LGRVRIVIGVGSAGASSDPGSAGRSQIIKIKKRQSGDQLDDERDGRVREGGDTWGNRAEREVRNGKGKREGGSGSGICRGRRRMDGLGEEEWG
jgi:hypothetical protein